ncbi:related to Translin [Moesziomyces antarcticus]|uniref:Related to Translin n=1 Tax=Pseudozyma antarctica TaxID=84753 RepID=A0A5C3FI14_PSEA2|nr:related to Translin [Moesziomyces antarcticus]
MAEAADTSRISVAAQFEPLFAELEAERSRSDAIREQAKELDRCHRSLALLLNSVHSTNDAEKRIVDESKAIVVKLRQKVTELVELVPQGQFYRWCDDFSGAVRNVASSIALLVLLCTGSLVTKKQVEQVMGVDEGKASVHVATEDYLHGIINMLNELPRLAVNRVTMGDFRTPVRLASFVKQVHAGFQLLNLKNDSLRKRFDGIKYDVKKIEEVVYDISLRGLVKHEESSDEGLAFPLPPSQAQTLVDQYQLAA